MSAIEHNRVIDWPNGNGYTPCSVEYRETLDEKEAIVSRYHGENYNQYSSEDYENYCRLENKLAGLQLAGHIGKSVKY